MAAVVDTAVPERAEPATMLPRRFRVRRKQRETTDTVTLWLAPVDGGPLLFEPGQFTMVGVPGRGEAAISISGDPANPELLRHTIRAVGDATSALVGARPGDIVLVRGPYGTGWSVGDGAGGDVLVVAGGIGLAPLRPALLSLLGNRERYGRLVLLYGARSPDQLLFVRELERWAERAAIDVAVAVDTAQPGWHGRVGLVTALLGRAAWNPGSTLALVCGPELMMRLVAEAIVDKGVAPERVRVSMERNMKCGFGICGHCQIRELFVCTDGPVFGYDRIGPLMTTREL